MFIHATACIAIEKHAIACILFCPIDSGVLRIGYGKAFVFAESQ